jgi:F420-non-reducing hydrogenase small subunit
MTTTKPKLAMYWASSCGGCEISLANIHEVLLEIDQHFDFMFCPCLLDTKRSDIEALPDKDIFLTLFNGGIRTEENLAMAELLRQKSRVLVAFGACAASGGIPALANHHGINHLLETSFCAAPSIAETERLIPGVSSLVPEGELTLPPFLGRLLSLGQVVPIDYTMPGCPPEPEQIIAVVRLIASGQPLPPRGSLLGCTQKAVCDECPLEKRDIQARGIVRTCEVIPEPGWCLLEQGFTCMGSSVRGGCGALCPKVNMPCSGCYGALDRNGDPGAAALTALAAAIAPPGTNGESETEIVQLLHGAFSGLADPLGTFYRYSLAATALIEREPEGDQ